MRSDVPDSGRDEDPGSAGSVEAVHATGGDRAGREDREGLARTVRAVSANPIVGTGGSALTEAAVDLAETALFNSKVPASQPKYLVVDGTAYSQLRQIPRFSEYSSAGEAGLRALIDGNVGKIKDFYVFRSQFVPKTA
jgi:hypothetical protein